MQDEQTFTRGEMDAIVVAHIKKNTKLLKQELNKKHTEIEYA